MGMHRPRIRTAQEVGSRLGVLAAAAAFLFFAGILAPAHGLRVAFVSSGGGVLGLAVFLCVANALRFRGWKRRCIAVEDFVSADASPSFTVAEDGLVLSQNAAAERRFGNRRGEVLSAVLSGLLPSPAPIVFRLQAEAQANGSAHEDAVTRSGHLRLSVHALVPGRYLWRLEDMADRSASLGGEGIGLPMLTLSRAGTVLFMNEAMRRLVGGRRATLDAIINDLPLRPGETHEIAAASGPVRAAVIEIGGSLARREIYVLPVGVSAGHDDWALLDALPVPLLRIAVSGEILRSNRLARHLLDLRAGAEGNLSELVTGLGRPVADWLADASAGRGAARPEVVRAARIDSEVFLQIALGRIETAEEVSLIAVLHDATELKTLEAQFVQSQKMQAIGQLAGGVAHDFNNLLTAISGHCDLLLLKRDPGHPDYADLEQIAQNANRAASLVSQLLAFSRKQNLQPQLLDLRDTVSDLGHLLNRLVGEKITLALSHDPALKVVRADKRQLEQVLMNLVVNARDAMPRGGTIALSTEMQRILAPLHRDRAVVPPGEYVVVRVADEGTGIPADKLPKIFEPFFTTKKTGEGTGLGLSTAYGIVKQTGGYIFADSTLGVGTCFTILLPAHDRAAVEPAAPQAPARPVAAAHGDGVVLLVEDEAPVRAFASRALRMRGFTVLEAENAEDALKQLDDASLAIDVFVTDVIMPGMDGPSWVSKALEKRPETRVVFVSGYAEESFSESRARIPNSVFLPKPFSLNELTATVQAQMH